MSGSSGIATISQLNNWPSTVVYYEQRKVFGGSNQTPTGIWMTQPGNYKNMNTSVIPQDSDAITLTIAAPPPGASVQVNAIKAMLPMSSGLLVFTTGGAWQISGGSPGAAVTPSTVIAQAQAFDGISDRVSPIPIGYEILFVQSMGAIVRNLSYNFYTNVYTGTDLSTLSNHLFSERTIVSWAWAEEPHKLVWAVRDDGTLLSLTYVKEQDIYAWTQHDTQGLFEDVATVRENGRNAVYFVVRRYVGGAWVRYVERLAPRVFGGNVVRGVAPDPAIAWCVDAGLAYNRTYPAANLTISQFDSTTILLNADAAVFAAGDVGKTFRGGGGVATISQVLTSQQARATVVMAVSNTLQNDPDNTPIPLTPGTWSCTTPISTISGLSHLEGKLVSLLLDGNVVAPIRVLNGSVTLPYAATAVIAGLPFTWQLQTLPINPPGPTAKGRRKNINSVTMILQDSRGISMGPDFNSLTRLKSRKAVGPLNAQGSPLLTGEYRMNINSKWNTRGTICLQGNEPVPATILALVPEIMLGDS